MHPDRIRCITGSWVRKMQPIAVSRRMFLPDAVVAQTNLGPLTDTGFGPRMAGDNTGYREVFAELNIIRLQE